MKPKKKRSRWDLKSIPHNVRMHGLGNLDKVHRFLNDTFNVLTPIHLYQRIQKDIKFGEYNSVYHRIDIFSDLYLRISDFRRRYKVPLENLIEDKEERQKQIMSVWRCIEKGYFEGDITPYNDEIRIAMKACVKPKENKNG